MDRSLGFALSACSIPRFLLGLHDCACTPETATVLLVQANSAPDNSVVLLRSQSVTRPPPGELWGSPPSYLD